MAQKWREAAATSLNYQAEKARLPQKGLQESERREALEANMAAKVQEEALKRKAAADACAAQKAWELEEKAKLEAAEAEAQRAKEEAAQEARQQADLKAKKKLLAMKIEAGESRPDSEPTSPITPLETPPPLMDEPVEKKSQESEPGFLSFSLERQQAIHKERERVGLQEDAMLMAAEEVRIQRQSEKSLPAFTPQAGDLRSSVGDVFEEAVAGPMQWYTEEDSVVVDTIGDTEFEHQAELALSRVSVSVDPQAEEEWSDPESAADDDSFVSA